MKIFRLFTE